MKIVLISHACVESDNRKKIRRLKKRSGVDITLIVPRVWREGDRRIKFEKNAEDSFPVIPLPVLFEGR